jgi:phosphate transport system substrate-binding protein
VFAVNPAVKQSGITLSEAVDIYGGKIDRWKDGSPLRLVLRPVSDTDTVHLERMSPRMAAALAQARRREGLIVALTDHESADAIEDTPGAFGTTTLAMVASEKRKIKILSLSGVTPSGNAVRDGSYPYAKTFHLVTGPNPSRAATKFIAFLRSPAGSSILDRAGHVPLP